MANQSRAADRQWARDSKLPTHNEIYYNLIGQLIRDGKTVFYINLRNGKTKEDHPALLTNYLIRNNYV